MAQLEVYMKSLSFFVEKGKILQVRNNFCFFLPQRGTGSSPQGLPFFAGNML